MSIETAVKERPIPFSSPMVRAILSGAKTQTRRIVKPQPIRTDESPIRFPEPGKFYACPNCLPTGDDNGLVIAHCESPGTTHYMGQEAFVEEFCPYGIRGDRLWVRETWAVSARESHWERGQLVFNAGQQLHGEFTLLDIDRVKMTTHYKADGEVDGARWRPSIHMPRRRSRITLEITGVRVERLQGISDDDARAEGCDAKWAVKEHVPDGREGFGHLWRCINGDESWADNPWVWALTFKCITLPRPAVPAANGEKKDEDN